MKTYLKIVESFAVLHDPRNPERKPAFDVTAVTMIDLEDGSPPFMDPREPVKTLNMAQAKELGLEIPQLVSAFNTDAVKHLDVERKKVRDAESKIQELESVVSDLTAKNQKQK